jgi:hypothetical protein
MYTGAHLDDRVRSEDGGLGHRPAPGLTEGQPFARHPRRSRGSTGELLRNPRGRLLAHPLMGLTALPLGVGVDDLERLASSAATVPILVPGWPMPTRTN